MPLSPTETLVLDALDTPSMLAFLADFIKIPSLGGEETAAQDFVADWMLQNGFEVDAWDLDLDALQRHPDYSAEVHRREGRGVVGWIDGTGSGKTLILNGHVDVVPLGDPGSWSFPPWSGAVRDGRVLGRGALDMKGGLAAGLFAAKAILDAGVSLRGRLMVQSVIGEEDGGVGTLATLLRGHMGDAAIIMEPTALAVCPAQAGVLNFRITIRGRSAHGCIRNEGVSALELFFRVHEALLALEVRRNHNGIDPLFEGFDLPFPLSVGTIKGGDWASSVPDWVQVEGRYGVRPSETLESAQAEFHEALDHLAVKDPWLRDHPPEVEWWGGRFHPARVEVEDPIVEELGASFRDLDRGDIRLEGVPYGSDMRHLVRVGRIPTVLFGPGDIRRAHAADESVAVDDLETVAKTLALTALRFCGHGYERTF